MGAKCLWWAPWRRGLGRGLKRRHSQIIHDCAHACTHTGSNSFVQLWGQAVTQQMAEQWISSSPKIPMVRQAYQAVPALISQLAILEAPMSFHPGRSGLDRGHAEFKGYSLHAVILPTGVYFHHTDQCFRPEGSSRDSSSFRIETLIVMKTPYRGIKAVLHQCMDRWVQNVVFYLNRKIEFSWRGEQKTVLHLIETCQDSRFLIIIFDNNK